MAQAKQYLISFLFTSQGGKLVAKQVESIEKTIKQTGTSAGKAKILTDDYIKALRRVAIVVPVWLLFRSIIMGIIRTFRDVIKANLELENSLARIRTLLIGTSTQIESDMNIMETAITSMATRSSASLKELADTMYFLRTANLDTKEAVSALTPVVNLAVGTQNNLAETARLVAGIYNTIGNRIKGVATSSEKFQKISDLLAFTYATQDVQLKELGDSYTKLAPFLTGTTDSFEEIITTLGFLNTLMLRSGRAGRLTARGIIQITKSANKLAEIFGITFDEKKQLSFLGTLQLIRDTMGDTTNITAEQGQALQEVFATRGAAPIRLLLPQLDRLQRMIGLARDNAQGFAERMNDIKLQTVTQQAKRFKNELAVLLNDFSAGVFAAGGYAEALQMINRALVEMRPLIQDFGMSIGFVFTNLSQFILMVQEFLSVASDPPNEFLKFVRDMTNIPVDEILRIRNAFKEIANADIKFISFKEYTKQVKEAKKASEELVKDQKAMGEMSQIISDAGKEVVGLQGKENNNKKLSLTLLKEQNQELSSQINLLKTIGANELDIARFKLKSFNVIKERLDPNTRALEERKLQLNLIEKSASFQIDLTKQLVNHELEILKIRGANSEQIVRAQIALEKLLLGENSKNMELQRSLQLEQAITAQKENQSNISRESIVLMKIAQRHGIDVAKSIAEVLRGRKTIEELPTFGNEKQVLKKFFPKFTKQIEARKFFFEDEGKEIPIKERKLTEIDFSREIRRSKRRILFKKIRESLKQADITKQIESVLPRQIMAEFDIKSPVIPVKVEATVNVVTDPKQIKINTVKAITDYINSPKGKKQILKS